jgi:glycerol-3-phosphate dehydrogenase
MPSDVKWSYAGVRPLFDDAAAEASKVTRDYKLELCEAPAAGVLLSVFGGKITTYRRLAEASMAKLQPHIGGTRRDWTSSAALPGGDLPERNFPTFFAECRRRWPFMPELWLLRMARAYGTKVEQILLRAKGVADLGTHFGAGLTQAEVAYLRDHEWAVTAEDVLWRRSKLGLQMSVAEQNAFMAAPAVRSFS